MLKRFIQEFSNIYNNFIMYVFVLKLENSEMIEPCTYILHFYLLN